jgi:hypothetical protein
MKAGKKAIPKEKLPKGVQVKDQAAKEVGMSRPTAEKALAVVDKIDELKASGEVEQAKVLTDVLNRKSVAAEYAQVAEPQGQVEPDDEPHPHFLSPYDWRLRFRALPGGPIHNGPVWQVRRASNLLGRSVGHVEQLKEMVGEQAQKELIAFLKSAKELKKRLREIRQLVNTAAASAEVTTECLSAAEAQ